jgi:hypothetical protein
VWSVASAHPSYAEDVLTFLDIDSFSSYKETSLPRMTINGHSGNKEERCIRVKSNEMWFKTVKSVKGETQGNKND